jgi:hypothetical protein
MDKTIAEMPNHMQYSWLVMRVNIENGSVVPSALEGICIGNLTMNIFIYNVVVDIILIRQKILHMNSI